MAKQNIETKHKDLLNDLKTNPIFPAFEMWVDYKLLDKDIEIQGLKKKIDLCLAEIKSINLILELEEQSN